MGKTNNSALRDFFAGNAAPMLLSDAVLSSTAYIYACGNASAVLLFSTVSLIYSVLIFALYEKLRVFGKTWLTTIVVAVLTIFIFSFAPFLSDIRYIHDISLWFMEPSRFTGVHYGTTYMLILSMGYIIISCLYYFTKVRYRGVFLFLICLCPFCLFAKTFTPIPVICPIIIMTLFFLIMTGSADRKKNFHESGNGYLRCTLAFVLAVTIIASFFPKAESAPFRENFDEFITGVSIGTQGIADYNDFSESSSSATSGNNDDEKIVMRFYGSPPKFIKRQCFNLYNSGDNTWSYLGNANEGDSNWNEYIKFEDPGVFYSEAGISSDTTNRNCRVQYENGNVHAIYTPDNLVSVKLHNSARPVFRTELDEYFIEYRQGDEIKSYFLEFSDINIIPEFSQKFTDEYASGLLDSENSEVIESAVSYLITKNQAKKYDQILLSQDMLNTCYSTISGRNRVAELAKSLTEKCECDYDRAKALEAYFHGSEFIYDKEFTTPNTYPDYFIFTSKRGACAAYATAMTLMCRELGMTARYCEGFLISKHSSDGNFFYVTSADSHAFVQVWIDGYGWTAFDPTSPTTDDGYFDMTFIFVGGAAAVFFLAGALVFILKPIIREAKSVRRIKRARGTEQYILIYRKINAKLNGYLKKRSNTFTPADTAGLCGELFGYDLSGFIQDYETAVYGGRADENTDNRPVYEGFIKAYKAKLRHERKRRKNGDLSRR
ncbi:MAG: transglutaminase domain-containing protein [Ruminiclostridium sp.]|nr:transglutaminase domain-containing protein [Ruminiclostridium sp.]